MRNRVKIYKINKCVNGVFFDNITHGRIGDGETCYVHLDDEKYNFDLVIDFDFTYELLSLGQNIISHKNFRKELVITEYIWIIKSFCIHTELEDEACNKRSEIKSYSSIQFSIKFQKYWDCDFTNWAILLKTAIIQFMKDENLLL